MSESERVMAAKGHEKRNQPADRIGHSGTDIAKLDRNDSHQPVRRGSSRADQQEPD